MKRSTNIIIKVFALVLVFFSGITIGTQKIGLYYDIGYFFHKGFIHNKFFTPFMIILLVLLLNILNNYKIKIKYGNGLFIFALFAYLMRMINPNASPSFTILGIPMVFNISEYVFLFMLLVFFSIPASLNKAIIERIFKDVLFFSTIRAIILLIIFFFGTVTTIRWGTYAIILDEGNTQLLFSFLGAMVFSFYLLTSKKKYLFMSLLLLGITFFSVQRSTALPGFIAILMLTMFAIIKALPLAARKSFIIVALFVIIFPLVTIQFPDSKFSFAAKRFAGIVKDREEVSNTAFSDTGHKKQAIITFLSALKEKPFWGVGYGNYGDAYLEGQSVSIHNAYASIWVREGIVNLLFYLFIIGIIVKHTIKLMYKINKYNYQKYLYRLTACFYLIGYFSAAWVMAPKVLDGFYFQILWFLIFFYIARYPEISNYHGKNNAYI